MKIVIATFNQDKLREMRELLPLQWAEFVSLREFPGASAAPEVGKTLEENALAKARAAMALTGLPAIADDTGLEVDALGGRPGVYSARFASPAATDAENNAHMVALLQGQPEPLTARYHCVIAVTGLDGGDHLFDGVCEGTLTLTPRGGGGFGYDPYFIPAGYEITFGEMTLAAKQALSHRGAAVRKLAEWLRSRR